MPDYPSLYCDSVLHSDLRDMAMYVVFSAFTSRPVSILATTKASLFFFYFMYASTNKNVPEWDLSQNPGRQAYV